MSSGWKTSQRLLVILMSLLCLYCHSLWGQTQHTNKNKPPEHFPDTFATRMRSARSPATNEHKHISNEHKGKRELRNISVAFHSPEYCADIVGDNAANMWFSARPSSPPPPQSGPCTCPWWQVGRASRSGCWIGLWRAALEPERGGNARSPYRPDCDCVCGSLRQRQETVRIVKTTNILNNFFCYQFSIPCWCLLAIIILPFCYG